VKLPESKQTDIQREEMESEDRRRVKSEHETKHWNEEKITSPEKDEAVRTYDREKPPRPKKHSDKEEDRSRRHDRNRNGSKEKDRDRHHRHHDRERRKSRSRERRRSNERKDKKEDRKSDASQSTPADTANPATNSESQFAEGSVEYWNALRARLGMKPLNK